MGLLERFSRLCLRFTPCAIVAYNAAPLIVGFMGGLAGAFLPLLAVEAAAPRYVQHAMVVLANIAAGAAAGIAAAAAKRPARVLVRGLDVVRVGDSVRVDVVAVNESSVAARDVTLYVTSFGFEGLELSLASLPEGLVLVSRDGSKCCLCSGCVVEGVSPEAYRVKTVARAPGQGVRVRGVHASLMPPRSILEAPVLQAELVDMTGCSGVLEDCSSIRRCGGEARVEGELLVVRVLSGGETIAVLASSVSETGEALVGLRVEAAGDPVPRLAEDVAVRVSVERVDGEWLVSVEASLGGGPAVRRWFTLRPYTCKPPRPPIA